jgi:hypothetical protein
LYSNTTANNNTAVGYQAGYTNSTNVNCTFIGYQAGYASTADTNTFVGRIAGTAVTTGGANTFIGDNSGGVVTTGAKNTIIGRYSGNQGGLNIRTASNYLVMSDGDGNVLQVIDSGKATWQPLSLTSKSAAATLTLAILQTGMIQYTGSAAALTFDTGSNIDAAGSIATNTALQFTVVNTGSGTATVTAATGVTIVGVATVAAASSGTFKFLKTAANTFVAYRM